MDIRSSNISAGATMTSSQDENITHKSLELVRSASETSLSSNRSKVSSISLGDNSGFTASGEHSIASTDASIIPGRWKYSKTRQLAFWYVLFCSVLFPCPITFAFQCGCKFLYKCEPSLQAGFSKRSLTHVKPCCGIFDAP